MCDVASRHEHCDEKVTKRLLSHTHRIMVGRKDVQVFETQQSAHNDADALRGPYKKL